MTEQVDELINLLETAQISPEEFDKRVEAILKMASDQAQEADVEAGAQAEELSERIQLARKKALAV